MRFPYGVSDFYKLITRGDLYVDRTDHIPLIENAGDSLLLLRPRRFGKSLLLSTLENYYDVVKADEFERLFGKLTIGQKPTPSHNQYLILRWDFSVIPSRPTFEQQEQVLTGYLNAEMRAFATKYAAYLPYPIELDPTYATASFWSLLSAVQQSNYKLYLLVDEYDNFANEVLMGGQPTSQERYEALVFGEGEFKTIFKAIKAAMAGRGLDRVFIAGVSPVVLHDVSSGFNIAKNVYFREDFNALCGFTESEVSSMVQQVINACTMPSEKFSEALTLMRTYYNGSCFSDEGGELIYNPTAVFYFLEYLQRTCQYPRELLDSNLAPDYMKLDYVSRLPGGEQTLLAALEPTTPLTVMTLAERFGIRQLLSASQTDAFMASLLYYLGVLTFGGESPTGQLILRIPNLIMRGLYAERLRDLFLPDNRIKNHAELIAQTFYSSGDLKPLCLFIEQQIFPIFDNRDYIQANKLMVKTAFLTLLFNHIFYIMDSEEELQRGYADLTMILRPEMRQHQLLDLLLEFKLIKLHTLGLNHREVREKSEADLKALDLVKNEFTAARQQAYSYRAGLQAKYRDKLKLRCFAVVAIGFERLLWEELYA